MVVLDPDQGRAAPIWFSNGSRVGGSVVSDIDACRVSAFSIYVLDVALDGVSWGAGRLG